MAEKERFGCQYLNNEQALTSEWGGHCLLYWYFIDEIAQPISTLDLCCGLGSGTKMLSLAFKDNIILGVDYSIEAIEEAKLLNNNTNIKYEVLDVTTLKGLELLQTLVKKYNIKQCIFSQAIEHIPYESGIQVLKVLLLAGIEKIFVAMPFELEGEGIGGSHIVAFTPSVYKDFTNKFNVQLLGYLKDGSSPEQLKELIKDGLNKEKLWNHYFIQENNYLGSYMILVTGIK